MSSPVMVVPRLQSTEKASSGLAPHRPPLFPDGSQETADHRFYGYPCCVGIGLENKCPDSQLAELLQKNQGTSYLAVKEILAVAVQCPRSPYQDAPAV